MTFASADWMTLGRKFLKDTALSVMALHCCLAVENWF